MPHSYSSSRRASRSGKSVASRFPAQSWRLALLLFALLGLAPLGAWAQAPTITGFTPGSGPVGTTVTVTGTDLTNTTSVRFGDLPAAFTVASATQLTAVVPRYATNQKLCVTTTSGTALNAAAFSVTHPTASTLYPQVTVAFAGLNVGFYAAPALTDIDGDGKLDLLVGTSDGIIFHYEQNAVNSTGFTQVETLSFNDIAVGSNSKPTVTDIDGDGLLDLLIGEYDGNLNRYEQAAVNSSVFTLVTETFNNINVGIDSAPTFTDLDGDGLLDLLIGEADGNLNHYEQSAANSATFVLRTDTFNAINVGPSSAPTVTDLDADGLLDLLVGEENGNINHYEQNAANSTAFTLVTDTFYGIDPGDRSIPIVTDIDGDGQLDLLVGELNGTIFRYEQDDAPTALAISGTSVSENVPANTTVGSFTTTDPNAGDAFTYSLVAGTGSTDNALLNISGANLRITASPNFEAKSSYSVRVRTTDTDGLFFEQTFTITILDVPAPAITSINPTSGSIGSYVTITGTGLFGTTPVTFTGTSGNTVTTGYSVSADGTQITNILVPSGAQTGTINVTTAEGQTTSTQTFTITPPTITSISPLSGPVGTTITVTGTNLLGATAARVNGTAGTITGTVTATKVTFTVGTGSTTGLVSVTTAGGTATSTQTFTVAPPPPTITSISPLSGPVGTTITVTGTNLLGATAARVNGTAGT
ncbi:MAG: IPT/TIG domain-containing protein, partial [Hymenobacteraceae bacterium]|nr:IPT/TIG domain-containing protein [Hymenobacteraceae bacterium]